MNQVITNIQVAPFEGSDRSNSVGEEESAKQPDKALLYQMMALDLSKVEREDDGPSKK